MTAVTLGQALHDSLQKSAAAEHNIPADYYATWEQVQQPQRDRLESIARDVIAAYTEANGRDPVASHQFQLRGFSPRDENGNEGCASCGRPRDAHPAAETAAGSQPEVSAAGKCRAVKHGVVDLTCELPRDHDIPQDGKPGTWHKAVFTEHREITYDTGRHVIDNAETVTWEPVDHLAEATRHIITTRNRSTS